MSVIWGNNEYLHDANVIMVVGDDVLILSKITYWKGCIGWSYRGELFVGVKLEIIIQAT